MPIRKFGPNDYVKLLSCPDPIWLQLHTRMVRNSSFLSYSGPLQKKCPCLLGHRPVKEISAEGVILSQSPAGTGADFWKRCFSGVGKADSPWGKGGLFGRPFLRLPFSCPGGARPLSLLWIQSGNVGRVAVSLVDTARICGELRPGALFPPFSERIVS